MGPKEATWSFWASGNLELIYNTYDLNIGKYSYSWNIVD